MCTDEPIPAFEEGGNWSEEAALAVTGAANPQMTWKEHEIQTAGS
ncbi:40S ribosomal protein sa [Culex quinquefasciatus]|uniref:40S ribosomal protein sa n=1 Tax=Culex quinquefasciatus TaxID=7176 RepID=B0XLN0_CULQU|nr:40S ribosomal protein sa [Culex quinquefasciatus]|eukprot:XP_001870552.1 40S ribosomal protein sa [Culex quinquefasciatus]